MPGLAHVWSALGYGVANIRGRYEEWAQAAEQALHHCRLAGQRPTQLVRSRRRARLRAAPRGRGLADARCRSRRDPHPHPDAAPRALLLAMLGRFEEAWAIARHAPSERLRELTGYAGDGTVHARPRSPRSRATTRRGRHLRGYCDSLEERGHRGLPLDLRAAARPLAVRARPLRRGGAARAARPRARRASTTSPRRRCGGRCRRASTPTAASTPRPKRLAREAVAIVERTDALNFQGDALCDLAEVLPPPAARDEAADSARAGARALRAQEEPRHGRPGPPTPRRSSRPRRRGPTAMTIARGEGVAGYTDWRVGGRTKAVMDRRVLRRVRRVSDPSAWARRRRSLACARVRARGRGRRLRRGVRVPLPGRRHWCAATCVLCRST